MRQLTACGGRIRRAVIPGRTGGGPLHAPTRGFARLPEPFRRLARVRPRNRPRRRSGPPGGPPSRRATAAPAVRLIRAHGTPAPRRSARPAGRRRLDPGACAGRRLAGRALRPDRPRPLLRAAAARLHRLRAALAPAARPRRSRAPRPPDRACRRPSRTRSAPLAGRSGRVASCCRASTTPPLARPPSGGPAAICSGWGRWSRARRRTSSPRLRRGPAAGPRRRPGRGRRGAAGRRVAGPGVHMLGRRRRRHAAGAVRRGAGARDAVVAGGLRAAAARGRAHGMPSVVTDLPVFRETLADGALRAARATRRRWRTRCCASRASRACAAGSAPRRARVGADDLGARGRRAARRAGRRASARELHRRRRPARLRAPTSRVLLASLERVRPPARRSCRRQRLDRRRAAARPPAAAPRSRLAGNPGFGAANNAGVARARHDVTVLLNPDVDRCSTAPARARGLARAPTRCTSRACSTPTAPSAQRAPAARAGRARCCPRSSTRACCRAAPRERADPWRAETAREVGWAIAARARRRGRRPCGALGPFDPAAFLFYEDLELASGRGRRRPDDPASRPAAWSTRGQHSPGPRSGRRAELQARRREACGPRSGPRALALDDAAQARDVRHPRGRPRRAAPRRLAPARPARGAAARPAVPA